MTIIWDFLSTKEPLLKKLKDHEIITHVQFSFHQLAIFREGFSHFILIWFYIYLRPFGFHQCSTFWEEDIAVGDSIIKWGRVGIPLTNLALPHFCVCPKLRPRFPTSYVIVFFMFNGMRWEVIVHLVDIGGIVDHHFLWPSWSWLYGSWIYH